MARIEGEITISRPVDVVFDYVADQTNEPQYNSRMVRAEKVSAGPIGKGTTFRSAVRSAGRTADMLIEFTGYDRPRLLASTTTMKQADIEGMVTYLALYPALKDLGRSLAALGTAVGGSAWALTLAIPTKTTGSPALVYLSDQSTATTDPARRAALAAAAETLIAQNRTPVIVGPLTAVGLLIVSIVMLRGVFPRAVAHLGYRHGRSRRGQRGTAVRRRGWVRRLRRADAGVDGSGRLEALPARQRHRADGTARTVAAGRVDHGKRDLHNHADWFAGGRYLAAAADLLRAGHQPICLVRMIRDARARPGWTFDDIEAGRDRLIARRRHRPDRRGGCCMGREAQRFLTGG